MFSTCLHSVAGDARRLEDFAVTAGFDAVGAADHALRAFLDHEDRARAAAERWSDALPGLIVGNWPG